MAVGITQPGGGLNPILFEDDTAAPNGLYYTEADFAAAFPALFVDLGTTPKSYRSLVSIQNGDGTGSAKTTWKGTRSSVFFDPTRTYLISATGRINRFTEWGLITTGADGEPIGYDGLEVYFGASTTLTGNLKLYGCELRNITAGGINGRILCLPSTVGVYSDLVDTDVFTAQTQGFGDSNVGINRIRRLTAAGTGAGLSGAIVQFSCTDADVITISFPNGQRKISTGALIVAKRVKFVGPSSECDVRTTTGAQLLATGWSRNCIKSSLPNVEDWAPFNSMICAGAGAPPAPGSLVELTDILGRLVCSAMTDALGQISFTSLASPIFLTVPFSNAILARGPDGAGGMREYGPFILRITKSGYPPIAKNLTWPYASFLTTEKEYEPLSLAEELQSPAATVDQPYFQDPDVAAMFLLEGQDVTVGGQITKGILRRFTAAVLTGQWNVPILGTGVVVTVKTGSLSALAIGVSLGTDGHTYKVRETRQIGDGALTEILLAES